MASWLPTSHKSASNDHHHLVPSSASANTGKVLLNNFLETYSVMILDFRDCLESPEFLI